MMVTILLGLIPDLQWGQIYKAGMGMPQKKLRELLDGMQPAYAEVPQFLTPRMVARLLRVMGYHEQAWTMLTRFASRPNYLDPRIPSYEHYGSVALRQLYYQLLGNQHEDATTQPESMRAGVLRDNIAAKSLVRRNEDSSMTCREWVQKLCRCEKNEGVLCAIIFHEL